MDLNFKTGEDLLQTLILIVLILFTLVLLVVVINIFMTLKTIMNEKAGIVPDPASKLSLWDRLNSLKPISEEKSLLLDHDYDGIKELDNHLPPWWLGMFYGAIVFAVIYLLNYHVWQWSPLPAEEYEIAMAEAAEMKSQRQDVEVNSIDENNVAMLDAAADIERGSTIYAGNCAVCHGGAGEGGVGPNLTDDYWLHGGSVSDIYKTIKYGVPEKGMISWEGTLKPADIQQVSSFIKTLYGTNPANPKAPQGEIYQAEEAAPAADAPAEEPAAEEVASI
ncbi:MAG: c-type cytochrome [Cytophagales bacterium]|nr:c-type cytochrome [Cytophagales bacterium]